MYININGSRSLIVRCYANKRCTSQVKITDCPVVQPIMYALKTKRKACIDRERASRYSASRLGVINSSIGREQCVVLYMVLGGLMLALGVGLLLGIAIAATTLIGVCCWKQLGL
jgi:tRNA/tmRNA/rRNA uracil-C5-methylase (TrmA/RlmC/RlmD family)